MGMPILACEPDVFPENLLGGEGGTDIGGAMVVALHDVAP